MRTYEESMQVIKSVVRQDEDALTVFIERGLWVAQAHFFVDEYRMVEAKSCELEKVLDSLADKIEEARA